MENIILIGVGLMIIYQSYKLITEQQKLKKDLAKMKADYNIEFKGPGGSVSRQRKNYPEQEHQANDDFRFTIEQTYKDGEKVILNGIEGTVASEPTTTELRDNIDRSKRHSLSGHMNDPSEVQKKAFKRENQV